MSFTAVASSYAKLFAAPVRHFLHPVHEREYYRRLSVCSGDSTPSSFLGGASDGFLYWVMTHSNELGQGQAPIPRLPSAWHQRNWTGASGENTMRQAFLFFKLVRGQLAKHGSVPLEKARILDFGSGWGRILRFFLRDVPPQQLKGRDCWAEIVDVAKADNPWCDLRAIGTHPPFEEPDGSIDVVYLFSVFSHLSEDAHLAWIREFRRVLAPGGIVVATTRTRNYLEKMDRNRRKDRTSGKYQSMLATESFPDIQATLAAYDRGEFCYSGTGGGGPLDASFYGEAAIPPSYAKARWEGFEIVDVVPPKGAIDQITIVARKL